MIQNFQDMIMKLHSFWGQEGCVLWQPYNIQVGAGTSNPATLLRVLGPEPWRVAYVEPSIRPDDGRYGENPNRMQMFYQYQVILKPDPGNPQELYLESLKALGIDPREHDIRFVEDNWANPSLGAWGLGWEVWMDGQEITQFTYFQQAGGVNLDPVSVEITYGLERIASALLNVDSVWDLEFTNGITYHDMFMQSEIEHCTYYFEIADVQKLKDTYDVYQEEHEHALSKGLIIPAYDYVLKCSHLFNVLDTRGAIGVTERAHFFRRMHTMTMNIAKAFVAQREELEHPITKMEAHWGIPYEPLKAVEIPTPSETGDVLFEIGTEELPAADVDIVLAQLQDSAPRLFDDLRLSHEGITCYATPRRLVIHAKQVSTHQADMTEEVKGPPANIAFKDGAPTKAAEGFARKNGVSVDELVIKDIDGGEYVTAVVEHTGQPATVVLAETLPDFIASLSFNKAMRWNSGGIAFSRPIRWIVALYGDQVIPFEYAHAKSGDTTRGIRPLSSPNITVTNAISYFEAIEDQGIILSVADRRSTIEAQAKALAEEVGGRIPDDPDLLTEITNLVEQPTALRGTFSDDFLKLPREVLVTVMRKHQRYFAVEDESGNLLPYFIAVRNGDSEHLDKVIAGNEHVLVARFSDGAFFYEADISQPLESYLEKLSTLTFQEKLGSMRDKNQRVTEMVRPFGDMLGAADDLVELVERAAELAKADLGTQMVVEMTSLQGTMGRIYATKDGENPVVANAIFEHWLPRSAEDKLPTSAAGVMLALLDRLDSLVGLFGVGLAPTGSADPYSMRRSALGIVQILIDRNLALDLRGAVQLVAEHQPVEVSIEHQNDLLNFIAGRIDVLLTEQNNAKDVVKAVLAKQSHNPARAVIAVKQLGEWVQHDNWEAILDAFARCARIIRPIEEIHTLNPDAFELPAEKSLYDAYETIRQALPQNYNINNFLSAFENAVPVVNQFFTDIMVMDEDLAKRNNRLALLQSLTGLANTIADFSELENF